MIDMNNESQIDEYVASIFESIDVSHFVQCLCDSQNITRKTALNKLNELVKNGLILHVSKVMDPATPKKEIPQNESERSTENAAKYQSLYAKNTSINVVRYDGSVSKEILCMLTIKKNRHLRYSKE